MREGRYGTGQPCRNQGCDARCADPNAPETRSTSLPFPKWETTSTGQTRYPFPTAHYNATTPAPPREVVYIPGTRSFIADSIHEFDYPPLLGERVGVRGYTRARNQDSRQHPIPSGLCASGRDRVPAIAALPRPRTDRNRFPGAASESARYTPPPIP